MFGVTTLAGIHCTNTILIISWSGCTVVGCAQVMGHCLHDCVLIDHLSQWKGQKKCYLANIYLQDYTVIIIKSIMLTLKLCITNTMDYLEPV